jgi:hypothetical protein
MPNSPITDAERDQIEELLDRIGVWGMMMALSEISIAKEGHVEEAWQDQRLAKRWGRLSQRFYKLAETIDDPYNS